MELSDVHHFTSMNRNESRKMINDAVQMIMT